MARKLDARALALVGAPALRGQAQSVPRAVAHPGSRAATATATAAARVRRPALVFPLSSPARVDGRTDGRTDRQTDGWVGGWVATRARAAERAGAATSPQRPSEHAGTPVSSPETHGRIHWYLRRRRQPRARRARDRWAGVASRAVLCCSRRAREDGSSMSAPGGQVTRCRSFLSAGGSRGLLACRALVATAGRRVGCRRLASTLSILKYEFWLFTTFFVDYNIGKVCTESRCPYALGSYSTVYGFHY